MQHEVVLRGCESHLRDHFIGGCYDNAKRNIPKRRNLKPKTIKRYELYKEFSLLDDWNDRYEYTNEHMVELYQQESCGVTRCSDNNGFLNGKRVMSITVEMWKEDIESGLLFKYELYEDWYPHWWLDSIFKEI